MTEERTTSAFDAHFARLLDAYADAGVHPVDAQAVAAHVTSAHRRRALTGIRAMPSLRLRGLAVAALVAVLAAALLLAVAGRSRPAVPMSPKDLLVAASGGVYVVDGQGTFINLGGGSRPAWSANHAIVVFADNNDRLVSLDRATGIRSDLGLAGSGEGPFFRTYESITISNDGRWILLGSAGLQSDYFILVDRSTGRRSTLDRALWKDSGMPAWAPTKDWAVAYTEHGVLLIDARTSPPSDRILDAIPCGMVAMGPTDRVACVSNGAVVVIDANGSENERRLVAGPEFLVGPAWSPDGATIAYATWGGGGHVGLIDVATGVVRALRAEPQDTAIEGLGWTAAGQLRLVLDGPGPSADSPRTIVEWVSLDGTVTAHLDLGSGIDAVVPPTAVQP